MSGSNRDDDTKAGLKSGLVVATLIAALVIWWGLLESAKYEREARDQTAEYTKYTSDKVAETCVGISPVEKFRCVGDALDARRQNERQEQDLIAQRQSALWAYIMAAAAVIGMGLSIIGVFLVWTTFRETKEANIIARKAMEVAEREAQAARDALVLAQRAIISIRRITFERCERENWFEAIVEIDNAGQSNAHKFRLDYSLCDTPIYPHDEGLAHVQQLRGICTADNNMRFHKFVVRKPESYPVYMIGCLTYFTVHETMFETFFCLKVAGAPTFMAEYQQWTNCILEETFCPSLPPSN